MTIISREYITEDERRRTTPIKFSLSFKNWLRPRQLPFKLQLPPPPTVVITYVPSGPKATLCGKAPSLKLPFPSLRSFTALSSPGGRLDQAAPFLSKAKYAPRAPSVIRILPKSRAAWTAVPEAVRSHFWSSGGRPLCRILIPDASAKMIA